MTGTAQSMAGGRKRTTPRRKRTTPRWRRAGPLVVLLAAVAVSVAACGGGGSHDPANGTSTQSPARQSGVLFAGCMRSHGVPNFPDPVPGGGFGTPSGVKHEPRFQSASQACQGDLPGGGPSAKHVNIREELNFAGCMRSHGVSNFPDPMPGGGWDIPGNTNSPQFEAAARACQTTGIHWNGS
jgi:hypothetical protein